MIELPNTPAPDLLKRWNKNNATKNLPFNDSQASDVKQAIREQRLREQGNLCVYCERDNVTDKYHIEHILCQNAHPEKRWDYNNLAVCCQSHDTCGHHKANRDLPIEPRSGCNQYFSLHSDGKIAAVIGTGREADAKGTCERLNLNTPKLVGLRHREIQVIEALLPDTSEQDLLDHLQGRPFRITLARYLKPPDNGTTIAATKHKPHESER